MHSELDRLFDLRVHDSERPPDRSELLTGARGCSGLVTMLSDQVDEELLAAAGQGLRVVANYAVGYDNVAVDAATRRGVLVANTPDVLTEATAELAIALMLALARRIGEGDRFLRSGERWDWAPTFMLGSSPRGRTLGIVGLGRIGAEVARRGRELGMRVVYTAPGGPRPSPFAWLPLAELLECSDIVSLHCPLLPETRHLIGGEELRAMRRDAFLVNTARGPIVDEDALVEALSGGEIAGAALDVFEHEPAVHEGLLGLDNVVLTPHLGSATHETRTAMGMLCVSALTSVLLEGRVPENVVNRQAVSSLS
ncbi:D-glycerate dehydrogenase [soil metagenome]